MRLDINKAKMKEDMSNMKKWRAICGLAFAHMLAKLAEWNNTDKKKISESLLAKALLHIRRVVKLNTFYVKEMKERYFAKGKRLPFDDMEDDERFIGLAIYSGASMFNHSCLKNASYFFTDGGGIVVVATDVILPGEEVFISYPFCEAVKKDLSQ